DLERFNVNNDICGRAAGDAMLRRVAGVLRERVGEAGTAARLGADEFGALVSDCDVADGRRVAAELIAAVPTARISWDGTLCTVTTSIGLVAVEAGATSPEVLSAAASG